MGPDLFIDFSQSADGSESFFCKGTAGGSFKVFFKIEGFLSVIEGNCSFHMPWFVLRGVIASSRVMRFQTGIKVFCKTRIKSFLIALGLQNVNIIELHPPTPHWLRRDRLRFSHTSKRSLVMACRLRPVASARQSSLVQIRSKSGLPRRSFRMPDTICPPSPKWLRRGILHFSLRSKRSMVEAAGIEPASENLPAELLHT